MRLPASERKKIFLEKEKMEYARNIQIKPINLNRKKERHYICEACGDYVINEPGWRWKYTISVAGTVTRTVCQECCPTPERAKQYFVEDHMENSNWDWDYILSHVEYYQE